MLIEAQASTQIMGYIVAIGLKMYFDKIDLGAALYCHLVVKRDNISERIKGQREVL